MKKIVRGNDFTLRIPVKKIVNGEQVSFPLTDCTDIAVHVVSKYKRTALPYTIDKESNDVLLADVDGTTLSLGTYALEVTGVSEGANWRSFEYEQFAIVDNNASSDTVFEDNTADNNTNIEDGNGDNANKGCMDVKIEGFAVDTALVVLPPVSARATIIELIANADAAIAAVRETEATVKASEEVRVENESLRQSAEEQRAESEATRQTAETQRTESEMERVANEEARKANEEARVAAEEKRATTFAELSEAANAAVGKVDEAAKTATDAADVATETAKKAMVATTEAERVNAELRGNVLTVTDRTGEVKTLDLMDQEEASNTKADIARIKESMGIYSDKPNITLTAKENNVAISADGVKVNKQGWAIAEFTAELGNIYLFNPGETSSDVCVFAEYIDKVETRAIDYAYMYDESGRVLTAKATYNGKTYTYTYDYSSSITTITDQDGNNVSSLPSVYTTTVGAYQPMTILNANAELPEDGYCRFVSNFTTASAIKIVVSYKVLSADLTMKVVRDGSTANMCSQLAKINKKVDEVNGRIEDDNYISLFSYKDSYIFIDGKEELIPAKKRVTFHPKTECRFYNAFGGDIKGIYKSLIFCKAKLQGLKSLRFMLNNSSISEFDASDIDTSQAKELPNFAKCENLKSINVSGWDTSKCEYLDLNFWGTSLEEINVKGWETKNVKQMASVFANTRFESLDLSTWDLSSVENFYGMFETKLKCLTLGENFGKVKDKCATLDFSKISAWDDSVKSLLTLYDRKANGMGVITIKLHANAKAKLGEDGIAQLTEKGYTIA